MWNLELIGRYHFFIDGEMINCSKIIGLEILLILILKFETFRDLTFFSCFMMKAIGFLFTIVPLDTQ